MDGAPGSRTSRSQLRRPRRDRARAGRQRLPAPRSQTPTVRSCSPSTRTSCTFVRSGKRSGVRCAGRDAAARRAQARGGRPRAGCPTETGVNSTRSSPRSSVSGLPTSTRSDVDARCPRRRERSPRRGAGRPTASPARTATRAQARPRRFARRCPTARLSSRPDSRYAPRRRVPSTCTILEQAVGPDAVVVVAEVPDTIRRQRFWKLSPFDQQVVVAERLPLRQCHVRSRPPDDRR